jgi:sarcosine oxidase, subunit gamma
MTGRISVVIAEAVRRSPLSDYAERFSALHESSQGALFIRELVFLTQLNLRANPKDSPLMKHLADTLGCPLPLEPNTVALGRDDRRALWLGPDEWLVVAAAGEAIPLEQRLRTGPSEAPASLVDVSSSRAVLRVGGDGARDLLAHCVPIDLDPRVFLAGRCAQTLLGKAQVIVERAPSEPDLNFYVRASFARYVANWLLDAAKRWKL